MLSFVVSVHLYPVAIPLKVRFHWKNDLTLNLPRDLGVSSSTANAAGLGADHYRGVDAADIATTQHARHTQHATALAAGSPVAASAADRAETASGPHSVGLVFIDTLHVYGQVSEAAAAARTGVLRVRALRHTQVKEHH